MALTTPQVNNNTYNFLLEKSAQNRGAAYSKPVTLKGGADLTLPLGNEATG